MTFGRSEHRRRREKSMTATDTHESRTGKVRRFAAVTLAVLVLLAFGGATASAAHAGPTTTPTGPGRP
jgi:hypothetical protein